MDFNNQKMTNHPLPRSIIININLVYKKLKKYNEIQLTKNKLDLAYGNVTSPMSDTLTIQRQCESDTSFCGSLCHLAT